MTYDLWLIRTVWSQTAMWVKPDKSKFLYFTPGTVRLLCHCRYHATLLLKRINAQEQGQYTFHAKSHMTNASITFQVQMYRT